MSAPTAAVETLPAGALPTHDGPGVLTLRWVPPDRPWLLVHGTVPSETVRSVAARLWASLGVGAPPVRGLEAAWDARRRGRLVPDPTVPLPSELMAALRLDVAPALHEAPTWDETVGGTTARLLQHHHQHHGAAPTWMRRAPGPGLPVPAPGSLDPWITGLLDPQAPRAARDLAAHAIGEHIARAGGPLAARTGFRDRAPPGAPAHWVGRYLSHGRHLYVGWTADHRLFLAVWRGADCLFGEGDGWLGPSGPLHRGVASLQACRELVAACTRVVAGLPPTRPTPDGLPVPADGSRPS